MYRNRTPRRTAGGNYFTRLKGFRDSARLAASLAGYRTNDQRECIGIEPSRNSREKPQIATEAAQKAAHAPTDPDLAALIDAWPRLPEPIKAGILALVRATGG